MGWLTEAYGGDHEGYVIALVTREGTLRGSGVYRALCSLNDKDDRDIERLGAECTCGWRSTHWAPICRAWTSKSGERYTLEWAPFSPIVGPDDDERAYQEWKRHIADVAARDQDPATAEASPQLRVVHSSAGELDPKEHLCMVLGEPRCWLKRHANEDGQAIASIPCDEYRPFCVVPGYCWCGGAVVRSSPDKTYEGRRLATPLIAKAYTREGALARSEGPVTRLALQAA